MHVSYVAVGDLDCLLLAIRQQSKLLLFDRLNVAAQRSLICQLHPDVLADARACGLAS